MRVVKHVIISLVVLVVNLLIFSCIPSSITYDGLAVSSEGIDIRVLVDKGKSFSLFSRGKLFFVDGIPLKDKIDILLDGTNLVINGISFGSMVDVYSDGNIVFNNIEYKGFFRFVVRNNVILAINVVNIEEYLECVVPSEVPALWPMEVLKAQAIVSRTYALKKIIENRNRDFDVFASYRSQVYLGLKKVHPRTTKAVEDTRGIVITHNGEIINAFFHANSGGFIETSEILGTESFPYLRPSIDKFSRDTFRSYWTAFVKEEEIVKKVFGSSKYRLLDIEIPYRLPSGSVRELRIIVKDHRGTYDKLLDIYRFREMFPVVLSPKFEVDIVGDKVIFRGYGWGHGVGMSQWGAKEMANQGYNYKEIIRYYYKDIEIQRLY